MWPDRPARGQTFTTGANPAGYTLDAITVQADRNALATNNYPVRVGSISGTSFTPLATESANFTTNITANDYVTFALTNPVSLAAGTTYGFDIGLNSTDGGFTDHGWGPLNNAQAEYADGSAYSSNGGGGFGGPTIGTHNQDRIFHLNMTAGALPPAPDSGLVASFDFSAASGGSDRGPAFGDGSNPDGLQFTGQVGAWVELQQNNPGGGPISAVDSQSGDPITFTFALNNEAYEHNGTGTAADAPRDDFWRIRPGNAAHTDVEWELTGLEPNGLYDLIFYSGANISRPTDISILGFNPVNDLDGDDNFTSVAADATGRISGLFLLPPGASDINTLAGLQVSAVMSSTGVPEPASIALWSLIGVALAGFGWRRTRRKR